jgi:pathogenesis-related protein 1
MRRCCALLAILLASCGGGGTEASDDGPGGDGPPGAGGDGPPGGVGEPAALAGITLAHNQVRAMVTTATPLPPLEWDPMLAATAAAWVAMCRDQDAPAGLIDHNPDRSAGAPYYVGENVFGAGGSPGAGTAAQAVDRWASERASYNYANNTCSGTCGHYTQIVWRTTRKLGCAIGTCPNLTFRTSLLCDYGPGGNTGGQRPY